MRKKRRKKSARGWKAISRLKGLTMKQKARMYRSGKRSKRRTRRNPRRRSRSRRRNLPLKVAYGNRKYSYRQLVKKLGMKKAVRAWRKKKRRHHGKKTLRRARKNPRRRAKRRGFRRKRRR